MSDEQLTAQQAADEIIELVRRTPVSGGQGDSAGLVMHGAYLLGYQRFCEISDLAKRSRGEEAMILTRTLLSLVARARYVDKPTDPVERRQRWDSYYRRQLGDDLGELKALAKIGIETDTAGIEREIERLDRENVPKLPDDAPLLHSLDLGVFHTRVYRPASASVHFSLERAIARVRGREHIDLEEGDPELAEEALTYAILVYGQLLKFSEKALHPLTQAACPP